MVAEGVEDVAARAELAALGRDAVQGPVLGPALAPADVPARVAARERPAGSPAPRNVQARRAARGR
jgi:EAL domain-containing protein (putative c-di-GMP-specific phosphodiesterase class I)